MIILVLTSLFIGVFNKTYKVSDFQGQLFKINSIASGIYQVNVGLENFQGLLIGYGDFNSDKATDLITVDPARRDIQIQYWLTDQFHEHKVCTGCNPSLGLIQGVIPADYNYDGLLDLLIVYKTTGFTNYILYQEKSADGFPTFQPGQIANFQSEQYPFVGDFNGDHNTSVMIYKDSVRQIYNTITSTATPLSNYASNYTGCMDVKEIVSQPFSVPIFNSIIDLNADCRADLVILSNNSNNQQVIEYWLTMNVDNQDISNRYCLKYTEPLAVGITIFSMNFVDMNFDGLVDMVLVAGNIETSLQYMIINYNKNDVNVNNLCQSASTSYPFDPLLLSNGTHRVVTQILDTRGFQFQIYDFNRIDLLGLFAPFLKFGDFKSTGYPEILATLKNTTSGQSASYYIQNIECKDCDFLSVKNPRILYFDQNPQGISGINALTMAPSINAAFFDYGENGRLDFLVNVINNRTKKTKATDNQTYGIAAYYNYLSIDAFYLKVLGLNGECKTSNDKNIPCLGGLYYGATYMFSVTDINGVYNPGVGFQLSQSAQSPLQLPYGYMGLGRTNNYIKDFTFGIPLTKGATKKWTPIIPNSQLIISPEGDNVNNWSISIFIEPTDAILIVVIVTIMVLIILIGVIVWKHIKEKEEDKKNQETFFQMFR